MSTFFKKVTPESYLGTYPYLWDQGPAALASALIPAVGQGAAAFEGSKEKGGIAPLLTSGELLGASGQLGGC